MGRTLLLCEPPEGRTALSSASPAAALRRCSMNAIAPSASASTTAAGTTEAIMMVVFDGPAGAAAAAWLVPA